MMSWDFLFLINEKTYASFKITQTNFVNVE